MSDDNTAQQAQTPSEALGQQQSAAPESDNSAVENQNENEQNEYSYVPEKFLNDGQPDFKALAESYTSLEKSFAEKRGASSVDDYNYQLQNADLFSDDMLPALKESALEWGLSGEQFLAVAGMLENVVGEQKTMFDQAIDQQYGTAEGTEKALRDAWGNDFEANLKAVDRAWNVYKPEGVGADAFTNDPNMYMMLARIGSELSEDSATNLSAGLGGDGADIETQIRELMNDPGYWDESTGIAAKVAKLLERKEASRAN